MNLLALETTCDETAAAIVTDRLEVLASVVASQDDLHRRFGGVVPEIASRAHVERILPVIDEALRKAGLRSREIDAVAVANTPGLAGSLLVGLVAAKALCVAREIPLIAVNHLQAHVYACRLAAGRERLSLRGPDRQRRAHQPVPLPRPAWISSSWAEPSTTRPARPSTRWPPCWACRIPAGRRSSGPPPGGNPRGLPLSPRFPPRRRAPGFQLQRPEDGRALCHCRARPARSRARCGSQPGQVADLAASFQEAVVDCLVGKAFAALEQTGLQAALRRRRRGRQRAGCGSGSKKRQAATASACSSPRWPFAPTTP